jgi:flagellar hook-associated protein 3 FlgL
MRVSTSQLYEQGISTLNKQTSQYMKLQNQLATGRRVLTPSDDPVASARALEVTQSKNLNTQYTQNQGAATDALNQEESSLASLGDTLQNIRDRVVQAGNASLDDSQRKMIATDLRAQFNQLLSIANTQDSSGQYLFAGYRGATQPFSGAVGIPVTYAGDQGARALQVSASRTMPISNSGDQVFMDIPESGGGKQSVFDTVDQLITAIETPGGAGLSTAVPTGLANIDFALDNALSIRADVGSRLAEVTSLGNAGSNLDLQYSTTLSRLQDLDYNSAVSEAAKLQATLGAAQKVFLQTSQLSLFQYL